MPRKIKFGSKLFKQLLIDNLSDVNITVCNHCGAPARDGYVCYRCGSEYPNSEELDYSDMISEVIYDIRESVK